MSLRFMTFAACGFSTVVTTHWWLKGWHESYALLLPWSSTAAWGRVEAGQLILQHSAIHLDMASLVGLLAVATAVSALAYIESALPGPEPVCPDCGRPARSDGPCEMCQADPYRRIADGHDSAWNWDRLT